MPYYSAKLNRYFCHEKLKFWLAELNEAVSNQAITIHRFDIEVEDLQDRSLRKH